MLGRLALSRNRRARYLSDLIMHAAYEAGLTDPPPPPTVEEQVAALQAELDRLKTQVQHQE